jgi:hypothetical protein
MIVQSENEFKRLFSRYLQFFQWFEEGVFVDPSTNENKISLLMIQFVLFVEENLLGVNSKLVVIDSFSYIQIKRDI